MFRAHNRTKCMDTTWIWVFFIFLTNLKNPLKKKEKHFLISDFASHPGPSIGAWILPQKESLCVRAVGVAKHTQIWWVTKCRRMSGKWLSPEASRSLWWTRWFSATVSVCHGQRPGWTSPASIPSARVSFSRIDWCTGRVVSLTLRVVVSFLPQQQLKIEKFNVCC